MKKELEQKKTELEESHTLSCEREKVAEEIQGLKGEIEEKRLLQHRYRRYRPEEAEKVKQVVEELLKRKETLEKRLLKLDHRLENLGEDHEEAIEVMKLELISSICQAHPEVKEHYSHLLANRERLETLKSELEDFAGKFKLFNHHLEEGANTHSYTKRRGILNFIFGRNPKVLLSQHIHLAALEAERLLKLLQPLKGEPLYGDFHAFLHHFLEDAQKPWNQSLYNQKFATLFQNFKKLWNELEKERARLVDALAENSKAIDQLIEGYSD